MRKINTTDISILQLEIIIFSLWIFMFIVMQDQNLTLTLTAACNVKLLSLQCCFLPLGLQKTASLSWWFSQSKRTFHIPVFPGQLSSEEWKIQQYFGRRSRVFLPSPLLFLSLRKIQCSSLIWAPLSTMSCLRSASAWPTLGPTEDISGTNQTLPTTLRRTILYLFGDKIWFKFQI